MERQGRGARDPTHPDQEGAHNAAGHKIVHKARTNRHETQTDRGRGEYKGRTNEMTNGEGEGKGGD